MYKFIIIDDELYSAEELSSLIDYKKYDMVCAGVFADSREALGYIENNEVDLVVSDIKMPQISGIDIARICFEKYPQVTVALISAYREFEYAKKAMEFGVTEYITKPIIYSEYESAIKRIKQRLDKKSAISNNDENVFLERKQMLYDFLTGALDLLSLKKYLEKSPCGIETEGACCAIISLCVKNVDGKYLRRVRRYGEEGFMLAIRQTIPSEIMNFAIAVVTQQISGTQILVCEKSHTDDFKEKALQCAEYITKSVESLLNIEMEPSIDACGETLADIRLEEDEQKAVNNQVYSIFSHIVNGEPDGAKRMLTEIKKNFGARRRIMNMYCNAVLSAADVVFAEKNKTLPTKKNDMDCNECISWLEETLELLCKSEEENGFVDIHKRLIEKTLVYMNENYMEDLTLEKVAGSIALSPVYFSAYFKKHTGERFVDYLIKLRMEKAMELIKNDLDIKINVLCESVGYKSMPYFYKIFKNYVGCSPTEYKQRIIDGMRK